jgi:cytochrome c-type biogenesis protein CcmH/NrfG
MAKAVAEPLAEDVVPEVEEIVAPPVAVAQPKPREPESVVDRTSDPFAAQKAYLKENPRDYDTWLKLARALWQADRREESLEAYSRLIRASKFIDVVTTELEQYLETWPDVAIQRVLGDAYMKGNQLEKALELYRQALEHL